MLRSRRYH